MPNFPTNSAFADWLSSRAVRLRSFLRRELVRLTNAKSEMPQAIELESRVLYDATPLAAILPNPDGIVSATDDALEFTHPLTLEFDAALAESIWLNLDDAQDQPPACLEIPNTSSNLEVVAIDQGVEGYEQLVDALRQMQLSGLNIEIILIDSDADGVQQLTDRLESLRNVRGVHVLSHANENGLQLGNTFLSGQSLAGYTSDFTRWRDALTGDADILFYGCELAEGESGRMFLNGLAALTQADVAASENLTGHGDLGGDWTLEYQSGGIESGVIASQMVQDSWRYTLATINVSTTADENNGNTSSISALQTTPGGAGISLREAIIAANNTAGDDTIVLGSGTFTLSISGASEDNSATGDLDIKSNVTITGAGIGSTTINANSVDRVLDVLTGTLNLNDLKITGGGGFSSGGGIHIASGATANLSHIDVDSNAPTDSLGAGIYNQGILSVTDSLIRNNDPGNADAGGLANTGTATLSRVSVIGNSAVNAGGIDSSGTVTLTNVTVSGNMADFDGGGIRITGGTANISFVTVADNNATSGNGGGLHRSAGTVNISSSAFGDNNSNFGGKDVNGAVTSGGYNIFENYSGFSLFGSDWAGSFNLPAVSIDGSSGQYFYSISTGGLAQNNGNPTGAPSTDIRGAARDANPDIGSYELITNSAPVLDASKSPSLTNENEDAGAPSGAVGTLVSNLVDFASPSGQVDNVTDPDFGALLGIAITSADTASGSWWYSTDNGTNWIALGSVGGASARLLAADAATRIYFQPNANFSGSISNAITFRAWDRTSGSNGNLADTSSNGGTTAFSSSTDTASLVVTAANDAPTITNGYTHTLNSTNEDTTSSGTLASAILTGASWADVDSGALSGLAITAKSGNGTWQYSTDGITWNGFGAVSATNALLITSTTQVRYVPDNTNGETATFTFKAWDQTSGTASTNAIPSYTSTASSGGTTAFSSNNSTAQIVVTSVNDEQVLSTNTGMTIAENAAGTTISNTMLLTTDVDHSANQLVYTLTSIPSNGTLRKSGVALSVSSTFTQADLDAGFLTYDHNGSETNSDSFSFSVDDGTGSTSSGTFSITITPVNDNSPQINSNGGGASAAIGVAENTASVTTVTATDTDLPSASLTYSITGGTDSSRFTINGSNGQLAFIDTPDYENPGDANQDNVYQVIVTVSDGLLTDAQTISVTVTNAPDAAAQAASAIGVVTGSSSESLANTTTSNDQYGPDVGGRTIGVDGAGNYVVVWFSQGQDGSGYGVYAQRYDAGGIAQGSEFQIHQTTVNDQAFSSVAMANDGSFVVVWSTTSADSGDIMARRFAADGTALGNEFIVNSTTIGQQWMPCVAMDGSGNFMVVWSSSASGNEEVLARRFDSSGVALGAEFGVNSTTGGSQWHPTVGMNDAGDTVIAWASENLDGSGYGIAAQRYNSSGTAVGSEFRVNVTTTGNQSRPEVVVDPNGGFAISWDSDAGGNSNVFFRRYDNSGIAVTSEIMAHAVNAQAQQYGSIDIDGNGNLLLAWSSYAQDGSDYGVYARRFSYAGVAFENEFLVNQTTSGTQDFANAAFLPTGDFVVSWEGNGSGDGVGVFSRQFHAAALTTEGGGTAQVLVVLNSAPTADVVIPLSISDATEGSIAVASLTFTAGNWNSPQSLTITGLQDYLNDGDQVYQLNLEASSSLDSGFNGVDSNDFQLTNVQVANVAPINSVPGGQTTNEEVALIFSTANGNAISVSDSDVGSGTIRVTLTAPDGLLTLNGTTGLTFVIGDGTDDAIVQFEGDITSINSALNGLSFQPNTNYSGSTTIQITSNDLGNSGSGGSLSDTDLINITVNGLNDEQIVATNTGMTVAENSFGTVITAVMLQTTDPDNSPTQLVYTVTSATSRGTLRRAGLALSANDTFTQADIDSGLIAYDHDGSENFSDGFGFSVDDGAGAATSGTFNITITPVNDNAPTITSQGGAASASINVAENSATVTTATAADSDLPPQTLTFSISGADAGLFSIDANTGTLTFNAAPNRESPTDSNGDNIYVVVVQASDGTLNDTQTLNITVTDVDEFDVGAVTDANATANLVAEDAIVGSTVGITANASDADATTNTITYSLDDDAAGRFAIDANTGVVTVAGPLDYETNSSHAITIRATSADGSFSTQTFTINVTNVNEAGVGPVSDNNPAPDTIAENSGIGALVGITAAASDPDSTDTVTYSLDDDAGGRFAIDANTGVVTVAGPIDREAASSYNITIRATSSDTSFTTVTLGVNITDVDEFDVGAVGDSDAAANSVAENAAIGTTVGVTASAADADATNNTISYSLQDNDGGRFSIDSLSGVITVASAINRETDGPTRNITVRATSADGSFTDQVFTINIPDVDEFDVTAPTDTDAVANAVDENAATGTLVGITANASDADATTNATTYSLVDDAGGRFAIDANTGVVTVADGTLLDRESAAAHNITVRAASADGSTADTTFTINLNDIDEFDVGAATDANATANSAAEDALIGSTVGITANASDADATTNTITYSLDDDAAGRFAIDSNTGVVTVAGPLDYETNSSHAITIRATSADGSSTIVNFAIAVQPSNDNFPVIVSDGGGLTAVLQVSEHTLNVTQVQATDLDLPVETIFYSILGGLDATRFTIDALTGQLSFVANVDFESPMDSDSNGIYEVWIQADDGVHADTQMLFVEVTDQNDIPVASDDSFSGGEDASLTGSVLANDFDQDGNVLSVVLLSGPAHAASFSLNSDGTFTYQPDLNFNGSDSFTYQISDGQGGQANATVDINIQPVNDSPFSLSDYYNVNQGDQLNEILGVLSNDYDVEFSPLIAILISPPASGTLAFQADGTFVYVPNQGFVGTDQFTYIAHDGSASGVPTIVEVNVLGAGPPGTGGSGSSSPNGYSGSAGESQNNEEEQDNSDSESQTDDDGAGLSSEQKGSTNLFGLLKPKATGGSVGGGQGGNLDESTLDGVVDRLSADRQALENSNRLMKQLFELLEAGLDGEVGSFEMNVNGKGYRVAINLNKIWEQFASLERELGEQRAPARLQILGIGLDVGTLTMAASLGYVIWFLRGGALMTTILTQLPAWKLIDPLVVMDSYAMAGGNAPDEFGRFFDR